MNRLHGLCCYLSGPMDRVPDRGTVWRDMMIPELRNRGIGVLNPLEKPFYEEGDDFSEDDVFIAKRDQFIKERRADELQHLMRHHVGRPDLAMVDKSDFLIVYIDVDVHMAGTYHELVISLTQRKPTLVVCKQGKWNVPPWWWGVIHHEFYFSSWDELLEYIDDVNEGRKTHKFWRFFDMKKIYKGIEL